MKTIYLTHPYDKRLIASGDSVLALGFFDGVHLGHQKVIQTAKQIAEARGCQLAVMSFNHHPSVIFQKKATKQYLTTLLQKQAQLKKLGVAIFYVVSFTSAFANLSPEQFEQLYLADLHAKVVVAGFDYSYGKQATGTIQHLKAKSDKPFEVVIVEESSDQQEKISSTRIRQALSEGDVATASRLLGRDYTTSGLIVRGDARGRELGFPTANIQVDIDQLLPAESIYVVRIKVGDTWYDGMASIGRNVTFESGRPITVEVNIFDFKRDIYGEQVTVAWLKRLRGEVKFTGVEALIVQLKEDERQSRSILNHEDVKHGI